MGTVFLAVVIFQQPDFRYASLFSAHCPLNISGQREALQGYTFISSIKGIVWLISLNGGSSVSSTFLHKGSAYFSSSVRAAVMAGSSTATALSSSRVSFPTATGTLSLLPTAIRAGFSPMLTLC